MVIPRSELCLTYNRQLNERDLFKYYFCWNFIN